MRLILIIFLLMGSHAFAGDLAGIKKNIYEIKYIGLRLWAVENDMRLPIYWNENQSEWKQPAQEAVRELSQIKQDLMGMAIEPELKNLKIKSISLIDILKRVYENIENKPQKQISKELEIFWEETAQYNDFFIKNIKDYFEPDISKEFDITQKVLYLFKNDEDRAQYKNALVLIEENRFKEANVILQELLRKYQGQVLEGSIISKIIDCYSYLITDSDGEGPGYGLELMDQVFQKKEYDLALYDLFEKWRTVEQRLNHGVSNTSEIPNKEYDQERWDIAQVILKHLAHHPDDQWANTQLILLMDLPIIERGNPNSLMGNTSLFH